ncbi:MAG: L-lactate dehydrogenase [Kiritimatiellia bacterium]
MRRNQRKVSVVGAGAVGSTFAYSLAQSGLADEIVLIDKNHKLVQGQVLDLAHGQPYFPAVSIRAGNPSDYADSQLIVITAGTAQRSGETRIELLCRNASIMRSIAADIAGQKSQAVVIVATNPVDVMTYVVMDCLKDGDGHVLGSGTVLDSARLRHLLSGHCGVDIHNVHAYILGEHGDSEFAAWSMVHVAGMTIDDYCPICGKCSDWQEKRRQIEQRVRDSAYHIIDYKGATWFAVGMALVRIATAVLRNENSVLTVSTKLNGEFGIRDVCLSLPCVVSGQGVEKIVVGSLPKEECAALENSAAVLGKAIAELD